MARFYATIHGEKGKASRAGAREMHGHIRGWNIGVRVDLRVNAKGNDEADIYLTAGSNGSGGDILLGTWECQMLNPAEGSGVKHTKKGN